LRDGNGNQVVGVVSVGRTGKPFTPRDRELVRYLAGQAARSIENVQLHETATTRSITDELTGIPNRRAFNDALASEVERCRRFGGSVGLILLDLDNFKSVNDTHGHQAGDEILRRVGQVLAGSVRHVDLAARYGGEEFGVIVPETDLDGAIELAERLRVALEAEEVMLLDGTRLSVTASFGAAVKGDLPGGENLVAAADEALYEAKRAGKNRVAPSPAREPAAKALRQTERRRRPD